MLEIIPQCCQVWFITGCSRQLVRPTGEMELGTKRPLWIRNHLHMKESKWGDPIHATQFRELLPAISADGDLDLKFLAANLVSWFRTCAGL